MITTLAQLYMKLGFHTSMLLQAILNAYLWRRVQCGVELLVWWPQRRCWRPSA
jgi:hypothetical protein